VLPQQWVEGCQRRQLRASTPSNPTPNRLSAKLPSTGTAAGTAAATGAKSMPFRLVRNSVAPPPITGATAKPKPPKVVAQLPLEIHEPLLSEILLDYYCPCARSGMSYKNRFTNFQAIGLVVLQDEVIRFASTFVYASEGPGHGVFSEVSTEAREAYAEFTTWLKTRAVGGR